MPSAPAVAEYRAGNERQNHVHKVSGLYEVAEVTCRRGVVDGTLLGSWMQRLHPGDAHLLRTVTVTLLDEARAPLRAWVLRDARPLRFEGPTLAARGGGDVAMEELVLSAESVDLAT